VKNQQPSRTCGAESGYALAVLLVGIAVMSVLMSAVMPAWRHQAQREKEAELVFRGEQYARAIGLFQRKYAGAFPPSVDVLIEQKFLRHRYRDPMTADGEFQILYQVAPAAPGQLPGGGGAAQPGLPVPPAAQPAPAPAGGRSGFATGTLGPRGGIIGVASKSKEQSIRLYNGRDRYDQWHFVYTAASQTVGAPGSARPGEIQGGQSGVAPRPGAPRPQPPGTVPAPRRPGS
jgi:type II secretory pathway pseudopilin PulG